MAKTAVAIAAIKVMSETGIVVAFRVVSGQCLWQARWVWRVEAYHTILAEQRRRRMHQFSLRVYYEDTDLAGIVYYANYLKFIERARSEWVRGLGVDQVALRAEAGLVFTVRRVEADYLLPSYFDDLLVVETSVLAHTGARIVLRQDVCRAGALLFSAQVTLVCLRLNGAAARLPQALRAAIGIFPPVTVE